METLKADRAQSLVGGRFLCQSRQPVFSNRLRSLLDMQRFYAHSFVRISNSIQELTDIGEYLQINLIEFATEQGVRKELAILKAESDLLQFSFVIQQIERIEDYLDTQGKNASPTVFREMLQDLRGRVHDSLAGHVFLEVNATHAALYFDKPMLFGLEVAERFPDAADDIAEAGTCHALNRSTACVMHLMRVVEVGLRALASALDLPNRPDWGKHLKDIEKELENRYKAAGCRTSDEEFYSEAAAQLGHVKTAWRNPTMHVDRTYTPERAEAILVAVRAFMQHLASRLSQV